MAGIAFFDFDGTLTRRDTFLPFAVMAAGRRRTLSALLLSLPDMICWKLGLLSAREAKERLFSRIFRGMEYDAFREAGERFASRVAADENAAVVAELERHRVDGRRIVIVSASISDWIRPWARSRGIIDVLATEVETDASGRLTGCFRTPDCQGPEKRKRMLEAFPELMELESVAYGNSEGDREMLESVRKPFLVKKGRIAPYAKSTRNNAS